jgi:oligoendopeptidase F
MTKTNSTKNPSWDLSPLYRGINDPNLKKDKAKIKNLASSFSGKYKGKVKTLSAKELNHAIKDIEALNEMLYIYLNFASYLHSTNTSSPKIGAFYQEANELANQIGSQLLWFSLEIQELPEGSANKLINSKDLSEYKHYLLQLRAFSEFRKSLPEEEIMTKLSMSGNDAFVRFFDETNASETFELDGKKLNSAELGAVLKDHPDANKRKKAASAYTETFKNNQKFYAFVLNTLLLDKKTEDEIRGYKYPQQATFLGYEVDPKTVDALVNTVSKNFKLSERYYKAKSKILGRKLFEWDRYSTLSHKSKNKISWKEAQEIVLSSFSEFDEEFAGIAKKFFDERWIDAEVKKDKRGGAFCSLGVPSKNPYILMSYTGEVDDVMTLAHELGHGIHAYLSRDKALSNYFPSTATAEIASVFCESIVFDYLYENAKTKREKLNLLANKIQGGFATIFRQVLFYQFETQIHEHRRKKGELSVSDFNTYFQSHLQKMFGKGLTLTEQHQYWWMPVLHFYHYNFYVFTYAFGETLTLALYKNYKNDDKNFVKNYKKALALGGSVSPKEITAKMGIDIGDKKFWQKGINLLEEYVDEFEKLAA